jgi:8-oxo-dGTP diphosphatase
VTYGAGPAPEFQIRLARCTAVHTEPTIPLIIVGAAIIDAGRVLACARAEPPEMAGRWEFPGGKVEPGEDEVAALVRECEEELGVRVEVGDRVGHDVVLGGGWALLRVYAARLLAGGQPRPIEHLELRWLGVDELQSVVWLPADAPIVAELPPLLVSGAAYD